MRRDRYKCHYHLGVDIGPRSCITVDILTYLNTLKDKPNETSGSAFRVLKTAQVSHLVCLGMYYILTFLLYRNSRITIASAKTRPNWSIDAIEML